MNVAMGVRIVGESSIDLFLDESKNLFRICSLERIIVY